MHGEFPTEYFGSKHFFGKDDLVTGDFLNAIINHLSDVIDEVIDKKIELSKIKSDSSIDEASVDI